MSARKGLRDALGQVSSLAMREAPQDHRYLVGHGGMPPGGHVPGGYGPPPPGIPGGPSGPGRPQGRHGKPITGSPETMALHAMTIDPKTGLPRGEKPPASTAAVVSLVCGVLLCLGPVTGLTAIVAGVIARGAARNNPTSVGGSGMALSGILHGIGNLLLSAIALLILLMSAL